MKIFVAYKCTGEDGVKLKLLLEELADRFESVGHNTYINLRDAENWGEKKLSPKEVIVGVFEEIKNCDAILALVMNSEKSEGMLLEIGYAKALGKNIFVAIKKENKAVFLREIADDIIEFSSVEDLKEKLKKIKS